MRPESYKKIFFITFNVVLLFFIATRVFLFKQSFLENFAATISYPFLVTSKNIVAPFKYISTQWQMYKKNKSEFDKLEKENQNLLEENIKLKSSLNFANKSLELRDFKKRYNLENTTLGKIITKNFSEEEHYFLINKGSSSGIKKNMIAIYKFQIIGKVVEVFRWYSKILLITDHNSKISAFTNNTNAPGIVVGKNEINNYEMIYTSHLHKVENNDFIISSGKGLIFPEGYCLGKIKDHSKSGIYHKIDIEPLVDFKTIEYCLLTNQEKMNVF